MADNWYDVKRLATDFQRAQLGSTAQRLSERNCREIVKKLLQMKLIEVIFTTDGKEYLTPQRLLKEIKDELYVHKGRVNLVDLAQIIGVDFSHIESKASEYAKSEPGVRIILGQLISSNYLNCLAEEVNTKLQQVGHITIGELTKLYDLPGDFLEEAIHQRLGKIIKAQAHVSDSRTFFTAYFANQHKARIQGALSALTRPTQVSNLIHRFKFPEKIFYSVSEELTKSRRIAGIFTYGKSNKAIFIPFIYSKTQNEWVEAFYKQNGYVEYDTLSRLGISDPKSYVHKRFKDRKVTFLNSCCVGQYILDQVESSIEEALSSGTLIDIMSIIPSVFTAEDCQQIIATVVKALLKQDTIIRVYCDSIVISDELIQTCKGSFEPLMNEKAQEDIVKKPQAFLTPQATKSSFSKREESGSKQKQDKKEDRRKKTGGKAGGGIQGRETKTKTVKKKYFSSKGDDSGSDEDTSSYSTKEGKHLELEFLEINAIKDHLQKISVLQDSPDELLLELAEEMFRPLAKKYQEVAKSIFTSTVASSGASRRKQHAEYQEKFTSLLSHITLFEKGIKLFTGDVATQLSKHLLKTLCTDVTNMIVNYLAVEHGLTSSTDINAELSLEARKKMIEKCPEDFKQPVMKLHNSLNSKTLEDFQSNVEIVLGAGLFDMLIRKADRKKERIMISNHRHSLLSQLSETTDPALCLHLAVLLIFQAQTHNMLHASGKFVPQIISHLQRQVPLDLYNTLTTYQEYVIKKLTVGANEEEAESVETILLEMLPKIKESAITYKKVSVSESEN